MSVELSVLEKSIWTDTDFERMTWHDNKVYAISFVEENKYELAFDLDYILQWVDVTEDVNYYKFWISPATLVFRNVYDINIDVDSVELEIIDVERFNPVIPKNVKYIKDELEYEWRITMSNGEITFKSVGFSQTLRQQPVLSESQFIDFNQRGGISFSRSRF